MQEHGHTPDPQRSEQPAAGECARKPRSPRHAVLAGGTVIAAVLVLTSSGCSGGPSASSTSSAAAAPAAASSCSASALAAGGSTQAGFGTTVQSWDCTRTPDTDFNPGSSYGADPTLPQINGHTGARYVAVQRQLGYVVAYQVNLHPHTTITAALADILHNEFPADANYLWRKTVTGQCYQAEVKSATLASSLNGTGVDDPTGTAFVEAKTLPSGGTEGFDPANVTYANLSFLAVTSADQAPGC